jgi:hypothetical protein
MAHLELVGAPTVAVGLVAGGLQTSGTGTVSGVVPDAGPVNGYINLSSLGDQYNEFAAAWVSSIGTAKTLSGTTGGFGLGIQPLSDHYSAMTTAQPESFAADMSTPSAVTLKIVPDAGDSVGQPVGVSLEAYLEGDISSGWTLSGMTGTLQAQFNGSATPPATISFDPIQQPPFGGMTEGAFSSTIGATFQISLTSHVAGTMTDSGTLNLQAVLSADTFYTVAGAVTPTALSFDAAKGSVDYAYTVNGGDLTQAPQITFAWASGTTAGTEIAKIPGTISGQTAASDTPYTGSRPGSDFSASPPPAGTKYLLMEIDDGQGTTSVISVPYNPSITVADHYGAGAGEPAGTFGRFFAGVPVPGESLTVNLSNEMAVLDHQAGGVVVNLGGHVLTLSPTSTPGQFVSQTFDPGQLKGSTPLTVTDPLGGAPLAPVKDTVDVIPLPKWFGVLNHLSEEFDPSKNSYVFTGSLVNVKTSTLPGYTLPDVPGLWLVSGLVGGPSSNVFDNGVDAHMNVTIVAPLNPAQAPTTETLQSGGSITFLGSPVGPSLPNTTTQLNLVPRTLELGAFTYTYKTSGKASVSLFKGKSFNQPPLKVTPSLTASASYTVTLTVTLTPTGGLSGTQSSLGFTVNAPFQGELLIPGFTLGSSALDGGISKLKTLITHSNPASAVISELTTYLTDALKNAGLLPSFSGSAKASGSVVLNGKVSLQGLPFAAQPTHGSLTGSVTLSAPTANLKFAFGGKSYDAASANLGGLLNQNLPIKKSF